MTSGIETKGSTTYDSLPITDGLELDPPALDENDKSDVDYGEVDTYIAPDELLPGEHKVLFVPRVFRAYSSSSERYVSPAVSPPMRSAMDVSLTLRDIENSTSDTREIPVISEEEVEHAPTYKDSSRAIGRTGIDAVTSQPGTYDTQTFKVGPSEAFQSALERVDNPEISFGSAMNIFHEVDLDPEETVTLLEHIAKRELSEGQRGRLNGFAEATIVARKKAALEQGTIEPSDIDLMLRAVDVISDSEDTDTDIILKDVEDTVELFEHPENATETSEQQNISIDPTLAHLVREAIKEYTDLLNAEKAAERPKKIHPIFIIKFNKKFTEADFSHSYGPKPVQTLQPESTQAVPASASF